MVLAISAAFCAAVVVLVVQHRSLNALNSQTTVILQQIAEQTANDVAVEARRALEGPVFETLTAVNHPELRAGRLDLVAREFADAVQTFPQVDHFFVWTAETDRRAPGEALFYGRDPPGADALKFEPGAVFGRNPPLGAAIVELARRYAPSQQIYVADEGVGPAGRAVFLRLFWTDARRLDFFAILGFVLEPSTVGPRLFASLHHGKVGDLLRQRGRDVPLDLRVLDERGAVIFGPGDAAPPRASARTTLPLAFYPVDRIESRLAHSMPLRTVTIEVSAPSSSLLWGSSGGYWPTAASALLILVALGLTVMANRRAAELGRMQADFVSHVSHQLKTPLSLVSAAAETLAMDRPRSPEKLAQYVGIIRDETRRLSGLVQRILELSRLEQRRGYEFEVVDLNPLVRETVAAFEHGLSDPLVAFRVEEHATPLRTVADPAAIEQVLVNLLDNAVKYSPSVKDILVRVRGTAASAVIEVVDRGIGLSKSDRSKIFEKFYRGSGAALHRGGFGLGLPIALELVQAHGGQIEVDSAPGVGATFRVVLALDRSERFEPASAIEARQREVTP